MVQFRGETLPGFTASCSILTTIIDNICNVSNPYADNKLNLIPQWSVIDTDKCGPGEGFNCFSDRHPSDDCEMRGEGEWVTLCDRRGGGKCWICTF